jgi:hypothetical protein
MFINSSVGIVMDYELDGMGLIPGRDKIFLFSIASKLALGPTQAPYPMGTGGNFPRGKVAGA